MRSVKEPKPVEKIELNEKHTKRNVIILIIVSIIGIAAFIFAFYKIANKDKGWTIITANTEKYPQADADFTFNYFVNSTGDYQNVIAKYSEYINFAKSEISNDYDQDNNIRYINKNPNKDIVVSDYLYNSLKDIKDFNNYLYLEPVLTYYETLIESMSTLYDSKNDPMTNTEIKEIINNLLPYINDRTKVELKLLDNNTVNLFVSDDYLKYLSDNGIENIISFTWLENAYVIDYVANSLADAGFKKGVIRTYDGYNRSIDDKAFTYKYTLFDTINKSSGEIGHFLYNGGTSLVNLKNFIVYSKDSNFLRVMSDGTTRSYYLDETTGTCKSSTRYLIGYNSDSCVNVAKTLAKIYIADTFDKTLIENNRDNMNFVWYEDKNIMHTEKNIELTITFTSKDYEYKGVIL